MRLTGGGHAGGGGCCFLFSAATSGGRRTERIKAAILAGKSGALGAFGCSGSGLLIHRNLFLTTHGCLPSPAAAEAAEVWIGGRGAAGVVARLVPQRFYITSSILDLTIVGLDIIDDSITQDKQIQYLKTCCKPSIYHGSLVYLLGHKSKNEIVVGEGKVVIATDNLIKLSVDGMTWSPGSTGFDSQGNLAFMICDPMKLASSPTARSSSSSSSMHWKKEHHLQFAIPLPVICDWLYQHWQGSLDEVSKPKLNLVRLGSSGQISEHSSTSFTLRHVLRIQEGDYGDGSMTSFQTKPEPHGLRSTANAKILHDENRLVDLRPKNEHGIATPEISESPRLGPSSIQNECAPHQHSDMHFSQQIPKTISLPLPLKLMLADETSKAGSKYITQSEETVVMSEPTQHSTIVVQHLDLLPASREDSSEMQSCSSPVDVLEIDLCGRISSEDETMYSAETMESRNIPSPIGSMLQPVGRSQSCVNYSRWCSPRSSSAQQALRKQHTLIPVRKTHSQSTSLQSRGHDYLSPTVSSSMKKRNSTEKAPAVRAQRSIVQGPPKWMF